MRCASTLGLLCLALLFLNAHADTKSYLTALFEDNGPWSSTPPGWTTGEPCTGNNGGPWGGLTCEGGQVTEVRLAGRGIAGTLPSPWELDTVTALDLSGNQIVGIPDSWSGLSVLEDLDLSDNDITTLPSTWTGLSTLNLLKLNGNKITAIPTGVDAWDPLSLVNSIALVDNKITELPSSWNLPLLTNLGLSLNPIRELPESWSGLPEIRSFTLTNGALSTLPDSWNGLSSLTALVLSTNKISQLPDNWSGLTNILDIELQKNLISDLPSAWTGLSNVETINLSENRITAIPSSWTGLSNVETIELQMNAIHTIPASGADLPTSLTELNLSDNAIHGQVPDDFPISGSSTTPLVNFANNKLCGSPPTSVFINGNGAENHFDCTSPPPSQCVGCTCDSALASCCQENEYRTLEGSCVSCHGFCASCNGPSSIECTSCPDPLILDQQAGADGEGKCWYTCSKGYAGSNSCNTCFGGCETCSGPASDECYTCEDAAGSLPAFFSKDGSCVSECGDGYFPQDSGRTCAPCPHDCAKCTAIDSCESCQDPFFLDSTGECVLTCGDGFFEDEGSAPDFQRTCTSCDSPCATCFGDSTTCTSCTSGFLRRTDDTCVSSADCPNRTWPNGTTGVCTACHPRCDVTDSQCAGPLPNCDAI